MKPMSYKIELRGTAPMLHHGVEKSLRKGAEMKSKSTDYEDEWKDTIYWNGKYVYVPATNIEGCIREAAKGKKVKGVFLSKATKSGLFVRDDEIPLLSNGGKIESLDDVEVDIRAVSIKKSRVLRSRALFREWSVSFILDVYDGVFSEKVLEELLDEAGMHQGIGDYRPRFGRFVVEKMEAVS